MRRWERWLSPARRRVAAHVRSVRHERVDPELSGSLKSQGFRRVFIFLFFYFFSSMNMRGQGLEYHQSSIPAACCAGRSWAVTWSRLLPPQMSSSFCQRCFISHSSEDAAFPCAQCVSLPTCVCVRMCVGGCICVRCSYCMAPSAVALRPHASLTYLLTRSAVFRKN